MVENLQNEELLETNHKLDALINNVKGILFRSKNDKDYRLEYISRSCLEITGYSFEDFKNENIIYGQLILEADRNYVWDHIQTAIRHGNTFDCEYRILHKNGSIKYVWKKGSAVYNNQNKIIALEGFIMDITTQKETEIELRHYKAKTMALLEAIPDIMYVQDYNGNYLDYYSNSPQKVLFPLKKCIGVNMKDVLPASVYKKLKKTHENAISSGALQIVEYSLKHKKEIEHYEARAVLMNNHSLLTIVREITKEKERNAQLNIKDSALASATNSITIADAQQLNTPIIYVNSAFENITGYKKKEVYGKNCNFLQNNDRDQKERNIIKNAITTGKACNVVLRNYRKDGTLFWNDVYITPVYNNKNILTHFIGIQNDITYKVKSQNLNKGIQNILELISEDKPLKTILKKIIDTIEVHLIDCIPLILQFNKVEKNVTILNKQKLPKTFYNFFVGRVMNPKVAPCGAASFLKKEIIVSNIEASDFIEDYKKMALKIGLKACWAFPAISSNNKVLGILSIYSAYEKQPTNEEKEMLLEMISLISIAFEKYYNRKIIEENHIQLESYAQRLEEKVRERTKEVKATVKKLVETNLHLQDQIFITQKAINEVNKTKNIITQVAKNFPNGIIMVVNEDLKIVLLEGDAQNQLNLQSILLGDITIDNLSFFSEAQITKIKENISMTFSGKHASFEIKYKNNYYLINTAPLFDENNKVKNVLLVYNDTSKQKQIELSMQNAIKKEIELSTLKSRFISMASHEFKTPLSAILTSAILLGKQNKFVNEEKKEKYITQIKRNVNHLINILNDFLSLSKLQEGELKVEKKTFDIVQHCKVWINDFKVILKKDQHIYFNSTLDYLYVNLDAKLLHHIILNLLSNASKYSKEKTAINFNIANHNNKVIIQITDHGIGIPEEEEQYIFNRFFRAKNANNIEGTGLGLHLAKHNAELMKGTILLKSRLNVGTTVLVELPINNEE